MKESLLRACTAAALALTMSGCSKGSEVEARPTVNPDAFSPLVQDAAQTCAHMGSITPGATIMFTIAEYFVPTNQPQPNPLFQNGRPQLTAQAESGKITPNAGATVFVGEVGMNRFFSAKVESRKPLARSDDEAQIAITGSCYQP